VRTLQHYFATVACYICVCVCAHPAGYSDQLRLRPDVLDTNINFNLPPDQVRALFVQGVFLCAHGQLGPIADVRDSGNACDIITTLL